MGHGRNGSWRSIPRDQRIRHFHQLHLLGAGNKIPPFVTNESISVPDRQLRVMCDINCDPNSENNNVPVYDDYTTFVNHTLPVAVEERPLLSVVSIDHWPSLVARETSDEFGEQLLPSLKTLDRPKKEGVWALAERVFKEKVNEVQSICILIFDTWMLSEGGMRNELRLIQSLDIVI